ncbi:hypothetical protein D3C76_1674320 [compost metagenome]
MFCIIEVIIPAHHDHLDLWVLSAKRLQQLHTVCVGHVHVRNDNVRLMLLDQLYGLLTILSLTCNGHAEFIPISQVAQNIPVPRFIVH